MNQTKSNIIANFAGKFVVAVLSIVFVPLYLRYLSVEMYGIIGFFSSIQTFLYLLDGGISPTLNREVARLSALPEKAQESRDLSRTLEILCWSSGLLVTVIALIVAPIAAKYWLKSENVPTEIIRESLMIMSLTFAFQWAAGFYTGGLYGLQKQKLLNAVNVFFAVIRSFGAFLVLAFVAPTIRAFLLWQLVTTAIGCLLLWFYFWRNLPKSPAKPRFKSVLLKEIWRYAAGITGTGLLTLILTQTDKIILSKMLTLEDFGYYSLAVTLAGSGISMIVGSILPTYFPQFSQLAAQNKIDELRLLYHRACQTMSLFLIPVVGLLAFFSYEILLVWTRKPEVAEKTYVLLTLVAIGTGLNGLVYLPYYAQLAFGITRIGFWQNVLAVIFLIPFMIYTTLHYGAVGGALTWVFLNFFYTTFGLYFMHRVILQGELKKWYLVDVGLPVLVVAVCNAIAYFVLTRGTSIATSPLQAVTLVGLTFFVTFAVTVAAVPLTRHFLMRRILKYEF